MLTHLNPSDPNYTASAASVKRFACRTCGKEFVSYRDAAPYCETCHAYTVPHGFIPEREVLAIKNTVKAPGSPSTRRKKSRGDRYEEQLVVRALRGTVYPRSGGPAMQVLVNMDAGAFTKGLVRIEWGTVRFTTSLNEIDAAFKPFDPTPRVIEVPGGRTVVEAPKPEAQSVTLGPIRIDGGKSRAAFEAMVATFSAQGQRASFALSDICAVLVKAV